MKKDDHWITTKSGKHIFIQDGKIYKKSEPKVASVSKPKNHIDHDFEIREQQIKANQNYNAMKQGMFNNAPETIKNQGERKNELKAENKPKLPKNSEFEKWTGGWMLVDKDKDRFEDGWDSGINIQEVSRVSTTHASGSGHSSTEYSVTYKGTPMTNHTFGSLKEAKDWVKKSSEEKPKKEESTLSRIKRETKERAQEKYGNQKWIERDESGEIIYKGVVKNVDTGEKKVMEFTGTSRKHALEQLKKNGYSLESQRVLPRKLYDEVIQSSNANTWDFDEASEAYNNELKTEKRQKDNDVSDQKSQTQDNFDLREKQMEASRSQAETASHQNNRDTTVSQSSSNDSNDDVISKYASKLNQASNKASYLAWLVRSGKITESQKEILRQTYKKPKK